MPLIQVIIMLAVVGMLLWLVNSVIPIDNSIRKIINLVVILAVILWLVSLFFPALWTSGPRIPAR